jgi:hypothetical protein
VVAEWPIFTAHSLCRKGLVIDFLKPIGKSSCIWPAGRQSWPSYGAPCQALKKRFPTEGVDPEERFNNPRSSHSTFDLPVAYAKRGSPNSRVTRGHLTIAAIWNQSIPKNQIRTRPSKIVFEVYYPRISYEHSLSDFLFPQTPLVLSVTRFRVSLDCQ